MAATGLTRTSRTSSFPVLPLVLALVVVAILVLFMALGGGGNQSSSNNDSGSGSGSNPPGNIDPTKTAIKLETTRRIIEWYDKNGNLVARVEQNLARVPDLLDDWTGNPVAWQSKLDSMVRGKGVGEWAWMQAERALWTPGTQRIVIDLSVDQWTTRHFATVLQYMQSIGKVEVIYSNPELGIWILKLGELFGG